METHEHRHDRSNSLQANDGVRRVSELQKEVAHLKQELHSCRLAAVQAAKDRSQLQVSTPVHN